MIDREYARRNIVAVIRIEHMIRPTIAEHKWLL